MKVVLDTNVLIASLISHGTCFELLEYCVKYHTIYTSQYIIDECREKLVTKFKYPHAIAEAATAMLCCRFIKVGPLQDTTVSFEDTDDIPVLQTALAAACELLVTGDKKLQKLGTYRSFKIISSAEFWSIG